MKIVWELGFDEAADRVDFELGDRSRFAVERDERDSAVRAERRGRVACEVVKVDEEVVLEEGLFHNLIAIAPAAADLESGKKGVEAFVAQFLVELLLVTGTGIYCVPAHGDIVRSRHKRPRKKVYLSSNKGRIVR
jgi:hypothetical protein